MNNFEMPSSQEQFLGKLQKEYNRPHLPEFFLEEVENFSKETGERRVYSIVDMGPEYTINGIPFDKDRFVSEFEASFRERKKDLSEEEIDSLLRRHKDKLEGFWGSAIRYNSDN